MTTTSAAALKWPRVLITLSTLAGLLGGAALLWLAYSGLQQAQWNAPRLAAVWAVAHGVNIYGTAQSGPFLGWIYGPMFPLYCAPAAWLGGLTAFATGAWLLNLLAALLPAAVCLRAAVRRADVLPLLTLYLALLLCSPLTQKQFLFLHVDTLCIGFGLLACWSLSRAVGGAGAGSVIRAAVFTALAIATKQVGVGLGLGLSLWLVVNRRYALLGRYLLWLAGLSLFFWSVCLVLVGTDRLIFSLWWYHVYNPTGSTTWAELGAETWRVVAGAWPWLLGFLVAWRGSMRARVANNDGNGGGDLRAALLWAALGVLPFGVLAASKVAGNINSVHSLNYLFVWLILALGRALPGLKEAVAPALVHAALVGAALIAGGMTAHRAEVTWKPSRQLEADLELARQHPGKVYFPWNPLVTLMTDGKIYPFDDALLCLNRSGLAPSAAAVLRDIPRGALIVYPDPVQSRFALTYLTARRPPEPAAKP